MNQADLFPPPLHHFVADSLAAEARAEIRAITAQARHDLELRFDRIVAFHNRSIAQRRRYWRLRTTKETSR